MDPEDDFEHAICDFIRNTTEKMGYPAQPRIMYREESKIGIRLDSDHSGMLIGRKGKNLDALQLLVNVVASRLEHGDMKIVLDSENYRSRREENLIRLAQRVGDQVKRSKSSQLLEPMNPFERRLIHTALNDIEGIATQSEGDGLYKQVRIYVRGNNDWQ
jgi:spoIIIJ-associated protein